ncbi:Permease of the major facilitator superfamily [Photobacterium marinum]|uniref:Permease of the major facilitator superfamily n=2 Tax=Photobacterium marinum TaxID=1056511 RepID=L8JDW2_9GAMM|nr:Permease of the major facilitator superfamily [Photobacterium marinum]
MSLIPLSLSSFKIDTNYASWLASTYYLGLLVGSMMIEPVIAKIGHRFAFISFLVLLAITVAMQPIFPNKDAWLLMRLIAGMAVAGIFVVVESWLLIGDSAEERAKRLGLYMTSLYGGTTIGQFGVGVIGTQGFGPFIAVLVLLLTALLPPLMVRQGQPAACQHQSLSLKQISRLSKPAMIGCLISGVVMGSIYGLMPLSLRQNHLDAEQISVLMAAIIMGGMLIQPVIGKVSVKMSKTLLLGMMSLLGVFAIGLTYVSDHYLIMIIALAMLGMSAFALYPIAITLACDHLDSSFIVAATQVMLFSYSIGSALGPVGASQFMKESNGLMNFFFIVLLATAIYMLFASIRRKTTVLAS